jgi:hypothetical protein
MADVSLPRTVAGIARGAARDGRVPTVTSNPVAVRRSSASTTAGA